MAGAASVGTVFALLRYTAVVEQGWAALSEGVARFFASYGARPRACLVCAHRCCPSPCYPPPSCVLPAGPCLLPRLPYPPPSPCQPLPCPIPHAHLTRPGRLAGARDRPAAAGPAQQARQARGARVPGARGRRRGRQRQRRRRGRHVGRLDATPDGGRLDGRRALPRPYIQLQASPGSVCVSLFSSWADAGFIPYCRRLGGDGPSLPDFGAQPMPPPPPCRGRPGNVLFAASFEAGPGDAVLVCGAPSAGRSTLLHLLHLDLTAGGGSVQFQVAGGAWLSYHPTSTDRYQMQQARGRCAGLLGGRGAGMVSLPAGRAGPPPPGTHPLPTPLQPPPPAPSPARLAHLQRMGYASPQSCIEAVFFASLQVCRAAWLVSAVPVVVGAGWLETAEPWVARQRMGPVAAAARCAAVRALTQLINTRAHAYTRRRTWCARASTCLRWLTARPQRRWRGWMPTWRACQTATRRWWARGWGNATATRTSTSARQHCVFMCVRR